MRMDKQAHKSRYDDDKCDHCGADNLETSWWTYTNDDISNGQWACFDCFTKYIERIESI